MGTSLSFYRGYAFNEQLKATMHEASGLPVTTMSTGVVEGLRAVGARRLIWGCDLTMETGLAKLRALEAIGLEPEKLALIRWRNAVRIFPAGTFPGLSEDVRPVLGSSTQAAQRAAVLASDS
jgi:maleate cis-trans isomerase